MANGASTPGGHRFSASFSSSSPATATAPVTAKQRKKRRGLLLAAGGVVIVALACAGIQLGANLRYDEALITFEAVAQDAEEHRRLLDDGLSALEETTTVATKVADADSGSLMDAATKETLATAIADAESIATDATSLHEQAVPRADEKPDWAWELFVETAQLDSDRDTAEGLVEDFTFASDDATGAIADLEDAGISAVRAASDAAHTFEAAHVSARNLDIIALRNAAERVQAVELLDEATASAYADFETAAAQMLTSEQAEIKEKAGQLYDARVQIEAFARELAPGVLLDFDWSERVNGYGYGDSMGGYATWWYADPGYATIELSNSVARDWPGDRSKALVAHEVGHTISVKCQDMYDASTQENIEAWATAWAISMGYRDQANGSWAYGAPPQSLIDAAANCR